MRYAICMSLVLLAVLCLSACSSKKSRGAPAVPAGPTVQFSGAPLSGDPPLTVNFIDMSYGSNVHTWLWDFGDGSTSSQQNPQHVYQYEGTFDVTLTATDDLGSNSLIKTAYILVGDGGYTGGDTEHDAGSGMYTAQDMLEYLNYMREIYAGTGGHGTAPHGGFDGYPWEGENLPEWQPYTWSITFTWDNDLAKEAQQEAYRLKNGGTPQGRKFSHQGYGGEPMWLSGLDTPKYMASGLSKPETVDYPWWKNNNGTARMALHYQTGTAPYNHKTRIGIGKADAGVNDVWWVFIYGEDQ